MLRHRGRKFDNQKKDNAFLTSTSDLMAGTLAIFILILSYFILSFGQANAQLTQSELNRAKMLKDIKTEMKKQGFEVTIDTKHGVLRIPEGVLFDQGYAIIKPRGKEVIEKLSGVISDIIVEPKYKGSIETIFIEGHTDNVPINNAHFHSNWELSAQRAINTWLMMKNSNEKLDEEKNENGEHIFSCSGYADTRPIESNNTFEGKKHNRRIDLRFSMMPPSEEDQTIIKDVKRRLDYE